MKIDLIEVEKIISDYEPKHSRFQIENFIIGRQGDKWAQYKQVLQEIKSRYDQVVYLREERELFKCRRWKLPAVTIRGRKIRQIEARREKRNYRKLLVELEHTERELSVLVELGRKIKTDIGGLDPKKRDKLEALSWFNKAQRMAGIDLLVNHRIGQSTMELILSLPDNDRLSIINLLDPKSRPDPMKLVGFNE